VSKGKSIIDMLWDDLDATMDILMDGGVEFDLEYTIDEYKGRAQGVAYALALMSNPYLKDVNDVRELAKERWLQRANDEPMSPLKTRPDVD
jgi:hypothetical protein